MFSPGPPELSIVIVSYNTRDLTTACIRSVQRETRGVRYEVIVFDNDSSDDSAGAIRKEFGDTVTLIPSSKNVGFARGNNVAVEKSNGVFVLLLNPDTLILDQAIDRLVQFAKSTPRARIWGGRTLFPNRSLNPDSCYSRQTLWSLMSQALGLSSLLSFSTFFNPEDIGAWDRQGERTVEIISGCFLLLKREFWDQLGGFDNRYFMYGEEADLCLRAAKHGAKPTVTSSATIVHYGGASEAVQADKIVRLLKAKMLLINDHFPPAKRKVGLLLLKCWPLSRTAIFNMVLKRFSQAHIQKARVWKEVWERRIEWAID